MYHLSYEKISRKDWKQGSYEPLKEKKKDSYRRSPGSMILPTVRKIIEMKTIFFLSEARGVEVQLTRVFLSAQGTLNIEWLLYIKVSLEDNIFLGVSFFFLNK